MSVTNYSRNNMFSDRSETDTSQTRIESIKGEVKKQKTDQIRKDFEEAASDAMFMKNDIEQAIRKTGRAPDSFGGEIKDRESKKGKVAHIKRTVQKILIAIQMKDKFSAKSEGQVSRQTLDLSNKVMQKIALAINPESVGEHSAPFIYQLIQSAAEGKLSSIDDLVREFNNIKLLESIDSPIYQKIQKALVEFAQTEGSLTNEAAERKFGISSQKQDFESAPDPTYQAFLDLYRTQNERDLFHAIYNGQFIEYVEKDFEDYKTKFKFKYPGAREYEINESYSSYLRTQIRLLAGRIYERADITNPSEFMETVEQRADYYTSPTTLITRIQQKLDAIEKSFSDTGNTLLDNISWVEVPIEESIQVRAKPMYQLAGRPAEIETIFNERQTNRTIASPLRRLEKVSFRDYILSIRKEIGTEIEHRRFFHNARAMLGHPVDEKGYYAALKHYAEEMMPSSTIDEFMHTPDIEIVLAASRMMDKLREGYYSFHNWKHQPTEDQPDPNTGLSKIENDAYNYLKMIYGNKIPEWRLKRALIMASGDNFSLSLRGLEVGSLADPPMFSEEGDSPTFASYGKRDAAIYRAFNPFAHDRFRWSQESQLVGNLLFLPIEGKKLGQLFGVYDHRDLLTEMRKGMAALEGGVAPEDAKNGVLRFFDLVNPGNVGGIYTRASWRSYFSYECWLVKDKDGYADPVKSWKALENIGIEVVRNLFSGGIGLKVPKDFYSDKNKQNQRKELFIHIYKRYFNPKVTDSDLNKEFEKIEKQADCAAAYSLFYHKAYTRAIIQRMPTKFIRMERQRDISGRLRAWEQVQKNSDLNQEEFDTAVKDIEATEIMLREEITELIKKELATGRAIDEIDLEGKYDLTREKVEGFLEKMIWKNPDGSNITPELKNIRIINALKFFDKNKEFIGNESYMDEFAKKYNKNQFQFAIAVEELERTLLAHRASGENTVARLTGEIDKSEKDIADVFVKFFDVLKATSIDGKRDFGEIIKLIQTSHNFLISIHGFGQANKIAYYMSALAINFFKKDTLAKSFFGTLTIGQKNSLAAEFSGRSANVWEWDSRTIDRFIVELETRRILPREPRELHKNPEFENRKLHIPFINKDIVLPFKKMKGESWYTSNTLRQRYGGDGKAIFVDILNRYLPIALAVLLFFWIKKAYEEWFGKKK